GVHALAHDLARLLHRVRVDRGAVAGLGLQDDLGAPLEVEGELGGRLPSALPDPGTDPAAQQQDQHGKGRQGYATCGHDAKFLRTADGRCSWGAPGPGRAREVQSRSRRTSSSRGASSETVTPGTPSSEEPESSAGAASSAVSSSFTAEAMA